MIIDELNFDVEPLLIGPDTHPRSSGVHVSDIYRDLEHGLNGNRPADSELSPLERARLGNYRMLGFAWERVLGYAMAECFIGGSIIRPQPLLVDGISLSPDLFDVERCELGEMKCTWRSMRRAESDLEGNFRAWFWQMKAYCKALGCTAAVLRVFFVNGDYAQSGPKPRMWRIEWTQEEIDDNWRMLVAHARGKGWL
jgi:hypothetical protein